MTLKETTSTLKNKFTNKLNSLQILRALAAILVLLVHGTGVVKQVFNETYLNQYFVMGNCGVDVFFVLSGFIIFYTNYKLIGNPASFWGFIKKRFIRIYPIYWIVTLAILPAYLFFRSLGQGDELSVNVLIPSFLLIPGYRSPILVSGWTLIHELLFYLLFSTIILFKPKVYKTIILGWIISIVILFFINFFTINVELNNRYLLLLTHPQNMEFLMGCVAAWIVVKVKNKSFLKHHIYYVKLSVILSILLIILSGFTPLINLDLFNLRTGIHVLFYGLSATILVISLALLDLRKQNHHDNVIATPFSIDYLTKHITSFMILLGEASYSIYLLHGLALSCLSKIMAALKLDRLLGSFTSSNLLFCLVILSGLLLYLYLELPLLNWMRRRFLH
ncbi:MAG: acyltransferase [Pseudanabaena sp. ELA607]